MTDFDPSERDELVSAYLDGEATVEERALVEGSADLLARAELLRSVSDQVAEAVVVDARTRERHIAAALEASGTSPTVTSLATRRKERNDRAWILSAAAVVLLLLIAIPIVRSGSDDDDVATGIDTSASSADSGDDGAARDESLQSTEADAPEGAADTSALAQEPSDTAEQDQDDADAAAAVEDDAMADDTGMDDAGADAEAAMEDEGTGDSTADDLPAATPAPDALFTASRMTLVAPVDLADLIDQVQATLDDDERVPPDADEPALACASALAEFVGDGTVTFTAVTELGPDPVELAVFTADGDPVLVVVAVSDCSTVAVEPL